MLLDDLIATGKLRHLAEATIDQYVYWYEKFVRFHRGDQWRHPADMGLVEVKAFLTYLAISGVSASTQNQALAAMQFLYGRVLGKPLANVKALRARRQKRQPEALAVEEVAAVLGQLQGNKRMVCLLLYGGGLRLKEALRLRVKDLDLSRRVMIVRNTKNHKDRFVPIPSSTIELLRAQVEYAREVWCADVAAGYDGTSFPYALERKYRNAAIKFPWQFVFPATQLTRWEDGTLRRHHLHSSAVQKAVSHAGEKAGIDRRVYPHLLRHSFVTHLLRAGYDIVTVQELVGHSDIRTTRGYATPMRIGDVVSPLDKLDLAF